MRLSRKSIAKLKQVKAAILAQPEFYSQNKWVTRIEPCGSTCCIAGWADFVVNGKKAHESKVKKLKARPGREFEVADEWVEITKEALGISFDEAETLTQGSGSWPVELFLEYEEATTPKQRAVVAGKYIDLFIENDGSFES